MLELKKENVQMLRVKNKAVSQVTFDVDYNVPDAQLPGVDHADTQIFDLPAQAQFIPALDSFQIHCFIHGK